MVSLSPSRRRSLKRAAEVDEAAPIGVVARRARDLESEHEADVGECDFGGEAGEARSRDKAGTGEPEVLIDDDDAIVGPAKFTGLAASAYCRSVDSRLCSTWAALDWRTQVDDGLADQSGFGFERSASTALHRVNRRGVRTQSAS